MFNVYLPKLLEGRGNSLEGSARTLEDSLWDVVIYAAGGCPGAIVRQYIPDAYFMSSSYLAGCTAG